MHLISKKTYSGLNMCYKIHTANWGQLVLFCHKQSSQDAMQP